MPRGVKKSTLEKLQQELLEVRDAITQYQECLTTLKEKERNLKQQLEVEEFKAVKEWMDGQNLTMEDLKQIMEERSVCQDVS